MIVMLMWEAAMIKYRTGFTTTHVAVSKFPGGEVKVDINVGSAPSSKTVESIRVDASLQTSDDIIALLLTVDALRRHFPRAEMDLWMPYMPYARQDRPCVNGEALSMAVMGSLINSCGFSTVLTLDAHSDVASAVIRNCENMPQSSIFKRLVDNFTDYYIVAPYAGAYKKAHSLATYLGAKGVICANKVRNVATGKIEGVQVLGHVKGLKLLVADDICDGGKTFDAYVFPVPARRAIVVVDGRTLDLPQTVSGSGIRYSDGTLVYHSKGRDAFIEVGGVMTYVNCIGDKP